MVSFFICINDGDKEFKRLFRRESQPRIGEYVRVGGSYGKVTGVWHDLEKETIPMIDLDLADVDFRSALKVGKWEQVT